MSKILVLGARGFLGRHLALFLLADWETVRCMARHPSRVQDLAQAACEVILGDMTNPGSVRKAVTSVQAVYSSVHTLSSQPGSKAGRSFMDVEMSGLQNIVMACRAQGVRRLIFVTFLGMQRDAPSAWTRGSWAAEQFPLKSGLDGTGIRPGQIVGVGGRGFDRMMSQARKSIAITMGNGSSKWRNIALSHLVYYLVGVLNEPRTYGQGYDVGCNDILTNDQMIDVAAEALGRRDPLKVSLPVSLLRPLTPQFERLTKVPSGAIRGILDGLRQDAIGDTLPLSKILPRPPLAHREAVVKTLQG